MSAVVQTFNMVSKEGRLKEARKEIKRAKKIYKKRGATSVRVFWAIDAGDRSGVVTMAVEYPSAKAYAKVVDSEDDQMRAVRRHLANGAGPVQILGTSLLREVKV